MSKPFKFGTCTVPNGKRGPWTIDEVTIKPEDTLLHNLRAARDGNGYLAVLPGTFKRLWHKQRGTVMSNTRMEVLTALNPYLWAHGRVHINGLGLGMVLEGILAKPTVEHVTVLELDPDVIKLVAPHFAHDKRCMIAQGDAHTCLPPRGVRYDYVWHDIWDSIDADNLPAMATLKRKWHKHAAAQGCWSEAEAKRDLRRYG